MDERHERLLDVLLREELASEQPPDVTERVLARVFPPFRVKLRIALFAASVLLVIGTIAWFSGSHYPDPEASQHVQVVGGGRVERGATLRTTDRPGTLHLGGYVTVAIEANTTLRISGEPHAESIALEAGEVQCAVTPGSGGFAVSTVAGTVSVVGTEFGVRVGDNEGDAKMIEKRVMVSVVAGAVLLGGAWGNAQLFAGEQRVFFADPGKAEAKGGTVIGVVTAKGENFIEVKADGEEKARRYTPKWVGGLPKDGGGFDKEVIGTVGKTPIGARVKLDWTFQERARVIKLEVLKADGDKKPEGDKKGDANKKANGDKK